LRFFFSEDRDLAIKAQLALRGVKVDASIVFAKSSRAVQERLELWLSSNEQSYSGVSGGAIATNGEITYEQFAEYVRGWGHLTFEADSDTDPRPTQWGVIEIEKLLRIFPGGGIRLVGQASPLEGKTAEERLSLSIRRAEATRAFFIKTVRGLATSLWTKADIDNLPNRIIATGIGDRAARNCVGAQPSSIDCSSFQRVDLEPVGPVAAKE
jgi:predicted outer membrane repeat protein